MVKSKLFPAFFEIIEKNINQFFGSISDQKLNILSEIFNFRNNYKKIKIKLWNETIFT